MKKAAPQKKTGRDITLGVRLSKSEEKKIRHEATKRGLSISTFVRAVALKAIQQDMIGV